MNPLQRTLIEKVGHEHGFENTLSGTSQDIVTLASARHRVRVFVSLHETGWQLDLPAGMLAQELARSFPLQQTQEGHFEVSSIAQLAQLLRRAAMLAQALPNQAALDYEQQVQAELRQLFTYGTEVERVVRQRVGQATFRAALMDYWHATCAVTSIDVPEVLRASHIKPWATCKNDDERLDVFNGFLLSANLDALFDRALISFDRNGKILISANLNTAQRLNLGLHTDLRLRWLTDRHDGYLSHHRDLFAAIG